MDFSFEEYQKNVEILRKNKENVPLELLKTKYAKGYNDLKCRIQKQTKDLIILQISAGMKVLEEDKADLDGIIDRIQAIINQENETMKQVSRIVFREYDIEKAMNLIAERIALPCFEKAYAPYFRKKCKMVDGKYRCDLLPGMAWNQEHKVWISEDGCSFTIMLPPTEESEDKE